MHYVLEWVAVFERVVVLELAVLVPVLEEVVTDREVASFVVAVFDFDTALRQEMAEMVAQEVTVLDHEAVLLEVLILEVVALDAITSFEVAALVAIAPEIAVHEVVVLEVAVLALVLEVVVLDRDVASFVVVVLDFDMALR